jgi:hypothetical protein
METYEPCETVVPNRHHGHLSSFSFVGSVGSELPFSTESPESCYIGKGNQWQQRIFLCLLYDPVTPVKVDDLIYGNKMAGCLISNQH